MKQSQLRDKKNNCITFKRFLYFSLLCLGIFTSTPSLALRDWVDEDPTNSSIDIVVIGDSYSAGNGAGNYYGPKNCYRSSDNWGSRYAEKLVAQGYEVHYRNQACSGAEIDYEKDEDPLHKDIWNQIPYIPAGTDLVLMTAGGNDLGFGDVVKQCFITITDHLNHCVENMSIAKANRQYIRSNLYDLFRAIRAQTNGRTRIAILGYPYLAVNDEYTIPGDLVLSSEYVNGVSIRDYVNINYFAYEGETTPHNDLNLENVISSEEIMEYFVSAESRAEGRNFDYSQVQAVFDANAAAGEDYVTFVNLKGLFQGHEPNPEEVNPDLWMFDTGIRDIRDEMYHFNPTGHKAIAEYLSENYGTFGADKRIQSPTDAELLEQMKLDALDAYYAAIAEKNSIENELRSRLELIKTIKEKVKNYTIILSQITSLADSTELTTTLLQSALNIAKSVSNDYVSEVEKAGRDLADAYAEQTRAKKARADADAALNSAIKNKNDKLAASNNARDNFIRLDAIADEAEEYAAYMGTLPVNDPNFTKQLEAAREDAKAKRKTADYADYAYGQAKLSYDAAYKLYLDKSKIFNDANTALNKANTVVSNYQINLTLAQNGYAFSEIDIVIELLEEELARQLDTTGGMIAYYQQAAGYKEATIEEKIQAELDLIESEKIRKEFAAQRDNASIEVYLAYHEVQRINNLIVEANLVDVGPTVLGDPAPVVERFEAPDYTVDADNGLPNFEGPTIVAAAKAVVTNKVKYVAGGARTASMSKLKFEGTDDAGLAFYAYKQSGITLENYEHFDPTGSSGIIHLFDLNSEESQAAPGDLIFYGFREGEKPASRGAWVLEWTNPDTGVEYDVETVGVYIGNGRLIDTQSSTVPKERSIDFSWVEQLGFFQIKSSQANDPVRKAAEAKAEEEAAIADAIAAANESAFIASNWAAAAAQDAQSASAAVLRVNAIVLVTDAALPYVNQVLVAEMDAQQAAQRAQSAANEVSFAADLADGAATSGIAIAAANSAREAELNAIKAASDANLAKTIAEGLADQAENVNDAARAAVIQNIADEAPAVIQLATAAAQAASTDADAAHIAADAATARAAVITAGEGDNAATANALAAAAQTAAANAEAAKQTAATAASKAAAIAATIASLTTITEAEQASESINAELATARQAAVTAAASKVEAEDAKIQNDAFKAYRILSVGSSGTWWDSAHWRRLGQAIGLSISNDNFGRSPAFETYGAYSSRAKVFQQYLNSKDGGKTSNIPVDGYWGAQTTEKLRAVLDYRCGTKLYIYGSVDGKGANGTTFVFNQDEASALAACLNIDKL